MSHAITLLNEPLSPPRIGGIAAALAIHVAALMLLMAPMTYAPPLPKSEEVYIVPDYDEPKKIELPEPPPVDIKVKEKPVEATLVKQQTVAPPDTPPIIFTEGAENDVPYIETQVEKIGTEIGPPSGPISLSTEYAPSPRYPALSLRNGEEGTVLLLVKVDATGKPIDVELKKSSGYRELDKNAMKHVLATWRFHPAMHQGIAIPAMALVPVNYKIDQ